MIGSGEEDPAARGGDESNLTEVDEVPRKLDASPTASASAATAPRSRSQAAQRVHRPTTRPTPSPATRWAASIAGMDEATRQSFLAWSCGATPTGEPGAVR